MVSTFPMQSYYRAPLSVDTQGHKFFEDEEATILDENILDQSALDSGLEMTPPMADSRRESFNMSSNFFSPKTEDWQSVDMQSIPSNNPFLEQHSTNPFMQAPQAPYQTHGWPMSSSGTATPMQTFDGLPAEFDSSSVSLFHRPGPMQGQTPLNNQVPMFPQLGHQSGQSMPPSPQKEPWLGQDMKNSPMVRRPEAGTAMIRTHSDLRRVDGIRKKNSRFEIPAERNLQNIDHLISQSTDEQEIKELKQQKRLLRNRQAALDSRQRKKQHTERLEDEKKQFTEVIAGMQDENSKLKAEMEQLLREKQDYEVYINDMERKHEEMIASHTLETGELRKKISFLTHQVQALEGNAMSTAQSVPHPSAFAGSFGDMDGITMDGSWDNVPMFDYPMEQTADIKQEMQLVPAAKKQEVILPSEVEKPSHPGGLLFMLFLVGAFVASSRSTPSIPRVSEDVRAASATLLESVLKDAGVQQSSVGLEAMMPQPSGTTDASWGQPSVPSMSSVGVPSVMDGVVPSMLGDMADALTQPSEEQANEQLFSLTAAQYNEVNSQDFLQHAPAERSTSQGRRNLAEALASMRNSGKQSAAEVYTRSLLWDSIPSDVVRSFAKMVAESNVPQRPQPQQVASKGET